MLETISEPIVHKPTALVVDDNEINMHVACKILKKGGFDVVVAVNGREGVEAFKRQVFDLVLMDLQMPILGGHDATREIRRSEVPPSHVPIIALSACVLPEEVALCYAAGMDDFVGKPFKRGELIDKCQHWTTPRSAAEA